MEDKYQYPPCQDCGRQEVVIALYGVNLSQLELSGKYCSSCLNKRLREEADDL